MADDTELGPLPDYKNPPVVETVLGVQFDRLPGLKNAHLGVFWKALEAGEWPTVGDAPLLPLQFERFEAIGGWARGVKVQLTQDPSGRVQIKNADGDRMIQVQNNRLHFNWLGGEGKTYPRYETVREGFVSVLQGFKQFVADEALGDFRPNQWEATYVNRIPKGTVWRTPADWGFFKPLGCVPTVENVVEAESFGGEWHCIIPQQRGRLHIEWQHERKDSDELIRLTLTARGPVTETSEGMEPILQGLDVGHAAIVRSFRSLMGKEANKYWGLKNGRDS